MPLDPRAKRFLDMAALSAAGTGVLPRAQQRRQTLAKLMQFSRADAVAGPGRDGALPGPAGDILYRLYTPDDAVDAPTPGLVFFHGGGMVAGSLETHDLVCRALTQESGCRLIAIDYRLAPEHKFPAAIEDAIAAMRWVAAHGSSLGIDPKKLVVGGDSAGATLAAVVTHMARQAGGPAIALQCLICPVLDFGEPRPSRLEFAEGHLIDKSTLEADLADYLPPGIDPADPRISPLRETNLAGLPGAIIHTAEFDPLRDEGNAYAQRLAAAAVAIEHICHPGVIHNFHCLGAVLPQGRAVLKQIGAQVRRALA